jgi:hypothetical protein
VITKRDRHSGARRQSARIRNLDMMAKNEIPGSRELRSHAPE